MDVWIPFFVPNIREICRMQGFPGPSQMIGVGRAVV